MSPGIPKYAAKRDANEAEIVDTLQCLSCVRQVHRLSQKGVPDLLVAVRALRHGVEDGIRWLFVEIKEPGKKLTSEQVAWWQRCEGPGVVIQAPADAVAAANAFSRGEDLRPWAWPGFAPKGAATPALLPNGARVMVTGESASEKALAADVMAALTARPPRSNATCRCGHERVDHAGSGGLCLAVGCRCESAEAGR